MSLYPNNSTQIIVSEVLLIENASIGENVTLIFQGGIIKIDTTENNAPSSLWKKGDVLITMGTNPSFEIISEDE